MRRLVRRLIGLFRARQDENELSAELASHLDLHIADNLRAGMPLEEARRRALMALGGYAQAQERYRERRAFSSVEALARDTRFALRGLARSPGFTALATLSIALGIGLNTTLFTFVNAILLRPLPVVDPSNLVDVYTSRIDGDPFGPNSYPDYLDVRARDDLFVDVIGYTPVFSTVALADAGRFTVGESVTGNYFRALGVAPLAGRSLTPADDTAGAERVVMISEGFWRREFAANREVIGTPMKIQGHLHTIVGVVPSSFNGMVPLLKPEFWKPVSGIESAEQMGISENVPSPGETEMLRRRGYRWMFVRARLRPGQSVASVAGALQATMSGLAQQHPPTNAERRIAVIGTSDVRLQPGVDRFVRRGALVTMAIGGLVLLTVCANIAGMLLVRASARQREFGVRVALGATRRRLVQQILTESLVLAGLGAATGTALSWTLVRFVGTASMKLPVTVGLDLSIDRGVLGFTAFVATLAGTLAALLPALQATRPNVLGAIKGSALPTAVAGRRWSFRDALAVVQLAVTMVLLVSSALLARSTFAARRADLGFATEGLASVAPGLFALGYDDAGLTAFYGRALERIRGLPGVESAALTRRLPLAVSFSPNGILVPELHSAGDKPVPTDTTVVSNDYFRTLGVPIVQGRDFLTSDRIMSPPVVVINQAMARRYWPNQSAVGKRFRGQSWSGPEYEVVGVSADYKVRTAGERPTPYIHYAASQRTTPPLIIMARTRGDTPALTATIKRELLAMEPRLVFVEFGTVSDQMRTTLLPGEAAAATVVTASMVSMLLAALGLYGVIAYAIGRRAREIGLRLALGSTRGRVRWLMMRQGLVLACLGLGLGAIPAAALARVVAGIVYPAGSDWIVWTVAGSILLATCLLANDVPARRASRLDPWAALKVD